LCKCSKTRGKRKCEEREGKRGKEREREGTAERQKEKHYFSPLNFKTIYFSNVLFNFQSIYRWNVRRE
jgi:hypothetical protein